MTDEAGSDEVSLPLPAIERIDRVCLKFEAELERFSLPAASGRRWCFTTDGLRVLSTAKDAKMLLWDLETRGLMQTFLSHTSTVKSQATKAALDSGER